MSAADGVTRIEEDPDMVSASSPRSTSPDLAIVLPTYNERENIAELIARIDCALTGIHWEAVFVDDDSPDGTGEVVLAYARHDVRIRLIKRVGRRGLSSACIEGMMATSADIITVMDADLQHDEKVLPRMMARMEQESLDVVVGTRNAAGGSMGRFSPKRVLLSRVGQKISHAAFACEITDPMSGFFMVSRSYLLEVVHDLQGGGFKILFDLLSSSQRPVRVGEVGYTFRTRLYGESKLDIAVGIEHLFLVLNKVMGFDLPLPTMFCLLIGSIGGVTDLLLLLVLSHTSHLHFIAAQAVATCAVMIEGFFLNNSVAHRQWRFRGKRVWSAATCYLLAGSFGVWSNLVLSQALYQSGTSWYMAGLAGTLVSSAWTLSFGSLITWKPRRTSNVRGIGSSLVESRTASR